jgi:pSer/pThr/pTyr-binding forkhead associated (FHA) protein
MNARIRVVGGPSSGETFDVSGGKLLIGREEDCHLRPDNEFVSRHHCALLLDDYTLRIRDLGSKNGTFVNGHRISAGETILMHDDVVAIGEMIFLIDLKQAVPLASPALEGTATYEGDTAKVDRQPAVRLSLQSAASSTHLPTGR